MSAAEYGITYLYMPTMGDIPKPCKNKDWYLIGIRGCVTSHTKTFNYCSYGGDHKPTSENLTISEYLCFFWCTKPGESADLLKALPSLVLDDSVIANPDLGTW